MKLDSLKKLKQASVKKTQKTKEKELLARKTIEEEEIETLRSRVTTEAPEDGIQSKSNSNTPFSAMPISSKTLDSLTNNNLTIATDIQAAAIPHALAGRDILGAAKTGSGKTLSFVIPLIEKLYREKWSSEDGLAAIIITPTRELALQIFDVIRIVGKKHNFSCGLVTGGKKEYEGEQERIISMNILVATPGRLLQHFEETPGFDASQVMMLVLDEADRILDLGFKQQLDNIIEYLPPRQTMLFSATQTKSVKDLARLSLNNPTYLAVHAEDDHVTPKQLVQNYIVVSLAEKLDVLFSFIKSHLKSKIIVFFATCSQVRFVYDCVRGMQPGVPLSALHGKIKQERRTLIYMDFVRRKSACLFATDIAARGLDFPDVDWVVQVDAPEDKAMYIHRVGRTARYNAVGRALMMTLPHEENTLIPMLQNNGVPIKKLTVNPKKTMSVGSQAAALLVAQPECRALAKKAFVGYLRSIQLIPSNRDLDVNTLPLDDFATSLGLAFTPIVPVVQKGEEGREQVRQSKNVNRSLDKLKKQIKEAKLAKRMAKEGANALSVSKSSNNVNEEEEEEEEEELFQVKADATHHYLESDSEEDRQKAQANKLDSSKLKKQIEKRQKLRIRSDGEAKNTVGKKVVFNEDGDVVDEPVRELAQAKRRIEKEDVEMYTRKVKARLDESREEDKARERERVREKHKAQRMSMKGEKASEVAVTLGGGGGSDDDEEEEASEEEEQEDVRMQEELVKKLLARKK